MRREAFYVDRDMRGILIKLKETVFFVSEEGTTKACESREVLKGRTCLYWHCLDVNEGLDWPQTQALATCANDLGKSVSSNLGEMQGLDQ